MDSIADFFLGIGILLTLAGLGVSTLLAFGIMAALGLVTELSFKRLFFISFGVAVLPTLIMGGILIGALQSGEVQSEISAEMREAFPNADGIPQFEDFRQGIEEGTIDGSELERILEESLPGSDVQIDGDGIRITTSNDGVVIDATPEDGVVIEGTETTGDDSVSRIEGN